MSYFSLFCAFLFVSSIFAAPGADSTSNGPCKTDSDCGSGNPYKFLKKDGDKLTDDSTTLKCCNDECYDPRVDKCYSWEGYIANSKVTKKACSKRWGTPCGSECCNTANQRCVKYSPINKGADYQDGWSCVAKLQGEPAIIIVAVPLIGIIAILAVLLLSVISLKEMFASMGARAKAVVGISFAMAFLSIFLLFSAGGWKYTAIICCTACLTILSLGGSSSTLAWLTILIQLSTFLYLLGPDFGNNAIVSFAATGSSGLIGVVGQCDLGNNALDSSYGGWFNARSAKGSNNYATNMPGNPAVAQWGYCSVEFLEFKMVVAVVEIVLSAFLFVIYTIASFTVTQGGDKAAPLLA